MTGSAGGILVSSPSSLDIPRVTDTCLFSATTAAVAASSILLLLFLLTFCCCCCCKSASGSLNPGAADERGKAPLGAGNDP